MSSSFNNHQQEVQTCLRLCSVGLVNSALHTFQTVKLQCHVAYLVSLIDLHLAQMGQYWQPAGFPRRKQ
jgi:hypothetical protein